MVVEVELNSCHTRGYVHLDEGQVIWSEIVRCVSHGSDCVTDVCDALLGMEFWKCCILTSCETDSWDAWMDVGCENVCVSENETFCTSSNVNVGVTFHESVDVEPDHLVS